MTGIEHYSLGLTDRDRVDDAFGGGLPAGSLVLVEGPVGAGKSVLVQRMAYGIATTGHAVSVVSTDMTAGELLDQMASLSYDVLDMLLQDRLAVFHADLGTDVGPTEDRRELLSTLLSPGPHWDGDVVFVDSFGALARAGPGPGASVDGSGMQRVVSRLNRATATDTTVVLTVTDGDVPEETLRPLRQAAEVYLHLGTETVGQEIRRSVRVKRFAGMNDQVDDVIGFTVQEGRGMVVVSRTVA